MNFRKIGLYGALCLASIIIVEGAARFWLWSPAAITDFGTPRQQFTPDDLGDWVPGQDGVWVDHLQLPFFVHTDESGFRSYADKGSHRVLVLGDSFTFGLHISQQDIWPRIAEQTVNALSDQVTVSFMNNGTPGGTLADYLSYLEEKVTPGQFDTLLIGFFQNDITDFALDETEVGFTRESKAMHARLQDNLLFKVRWWLRHHSGLYNLARSLKQSFYIRDGIERLKEEGGEMMRSAENPASKLSDQHVGQTTENLSERNPVTPNWANYRARYTKTFHAIADKAETLGMNMAGVIFPSAPSYGQTFSTTQFDSVSAGLLKARHVPFLHLRETFAAETDPRLLYLVTPYEEPALGAPPYPSDGHLSRYGNIVAGRAIGAFVSTLTD